MSDQLNQLGFMEFLGGRLVMRLGGIPPWAAGVVLVAVYVLLHYLFVSQTAHLLALFGVFLGVGVKLGVRRRCSPSSSLRDQLFRRHRPPGGERESPSLSGVATSRREISTAWAASTPGSASCCICWSEPPGCGWSPDNGFIVLLTH